jgi:translation initiation factor 2 subunit 2
MEYNHDNKQDDDVSNMFDLTLKKKKKRMKKDGSNDIIDDSPEDKDVKDVKDEDHTYIDLLDRVYAQLKMDHPNLFTRQKHVVPQPHVVKAGTKRTMISNFAMISKAIRRAMDHIKIYYEMELCTECSIDATCSLIIKGRYTSKQLTSILQKYISEYVLCQSCKTLNTLLTKDPITRLQFVTCEDCHSVRSVKIVSKI